MRYWVNTVSRSHVEEGMAGGFTQAGHGTESRLKRLSRGDVVVFYSPRAGFTAVAEVTDDAPFQASTDGQPWRRTARYLDVNEAAVQPLIDELEFIRNKKSWGVAFRRGFFEIEEADYNRIVAAMQSSGRA